MVTLIPLDPHPFDLTLIPLTKKASFLDLTLIPFPETAMANSLREHLARPDEARRLLCALYQTEADLLPDPEAGIMTVRLHHSANAATDRAIEKLCEELNDNSGLC